MEVRPVEMSDKNKVKPLKERTILVTRPREQATQLTQMLEQLGAKTILFPTITITPPASWEDCDRALATIDSYDAIIFTSSNAVAYFLDRAGLKRTDTTEILSQKPLFTISEKTRQAVGRYGLNASTFEKIRDSHSFGEALTQENVFGKKFLFPKGNLASSEFLSMIRDRGATVDEVVVYETRPPSDMDSDKIQKLLQREEIDLVLFFSPSSVKNFLERISDAFLVGVSIGAIGQTTEETARSFSLKVDIVAEVPNTENLVSAIVKYYE